MLKLCLVDLVVNCLISLYAVLAWPLAKENHYVLHGNVALHHFSVHSLLPLVTVHLPPLMESHFCDLGVFRRYHPCTGKLTTNIVLIIYCDSRLCLPSSFAASLWMD